MRESEFDEHGAPSDDIYSVPVRRPTDGQDYIGHKAI